MRIPRLVAKLVVYDPNTLTLSSLKSCKGGYIGLDEVSIRISKHTSFSSSINSVYTQYASLITICYPSYIAF